MAKEYRAGCGCLIHVIKWSAKSNCLTVKHCPLHKAATDLLRACKDSRIQIEYLHEKFKQTGSGNAVLAELTSVINRAEGI